MSKPQLSANPDRQRCESLKSNSAIRSHAADLYIFSTAHAFVLNQPKQRQCLHVVRDFLPPLALRNRSRAHTLIAARAMTNITHSSQGALVPISDLPIFRSFLAVTNPSNGWTRPLHCLFLSASMTGSQECFSLAPEIFAFFPFFHSVSITSLHPYSSPSPCAVVCRASCLLSFPF